MGSYDGAETCECVGLFLLSKLQELRTENWLYRDDGLGITRDTPRQNDLTRKYIEKIFKDNGLSITVETNRQVVDFLDVTLHIRDGSFTVENTTKGPMKHMWE